MATKFYTKFRVQGQKIIKTTTTKWNVETYTFIGYVNKNKIHKTKITAGILFSLITGFVFIFGECNNKEKDTHKQNGILFRSQQWS